ncbi:MAG TPA: hypothetical protein P5274_01905 [Candidatus Paceibacterota bacterium]|nr:hypothetical protein [Candidatus Paceibacterota bacterium]
MIDTKGKSCRSIIKPIIIIAVIFLVVGYSILKVKDLALGPEINLNSPTEGESLKTDLVMVEGKAERISQIFINGRKIFTDEEGNFNEPYLLASGYNLLEIMAQDKFGRKIEKKVQLTFKDK